MAHSLLKPQTILWLDSRWVFLERVNLRGGSSVIRGPPLSADSIIDRLFIRDTSALSGAFGLVADDIGREGSIWFPRGTDRQRR